MRRKILIGAAVTAAIITAAEVGLLIFLNDADLGARYRGTAENLLTDLLGREVRIRGNLEVDFGFNPRVDPENESP